jgi:hypothetical protein
VGKAQLAHQISKQKRWARLNAPLPTLRSG